MGSGCDSVGRAVASDSRVPRIESSRRQKIILNIFCQLHRKDKNKRKRLGMAHFFKKGNLIIVIAKIIFCQHPCLHDSLVWTIPRGETIKEIVSST